MLDERESLKEQIISLDQKIDQNPNIAQLWLERSILLNKIEKTQAAILSFRKAFKLQNPLDEDRFYNKSFQDKEILYKRILSFPDIEKNYLNAEFIKQHLDKKKETDEELKRKILNYKICMSNAFSLDISLLRKIFNCLSQIYKNNNKEKNKTKIFKYIEAEIDWLFDIDKYITPGIFFLKAKNTIKLKSIESACLDYSQISEWIKQSLDYYIDFRLEISSIIIEYTETVKTLCQSYKERSECNDKTRNIIISLFKHLDKLAYEAESNIDQSDFNEKKYLSVGDLYAEINEYDIAAEYYWSAFSSTIESSVYNITDKQANKYAKKFSKILFNLNQNRRLKIIRKLRTIRKDYKIEDNYAYILLRIGQSFSYNKDENKKQDSNLDDLYRFAVEIYNEALNNYKGKYEVKIIFEKIQVLKKLKEYNELEKLCEFILENGRLKFNQESRIVLRPYQYESILSTFLNAIFHKKKLEYRKKYKPFKTYILVSTLNKLKSVNLPELVDKKLELHARNASIHYARGAFCYDKVSRHNFSDSFSNKLWYLKQSLHELEEAERIFDKHIELEDIVDITNKSEYKFFLLQIHEKMLVILFALQSYFRYQSKKNKEKEKIFKKIEKFLPQGSKLLSSLLNDKNQRKVSKRLKNKSISYFEKTFELIDNFSISDFKDCAKALEQAEVRKHICLRNLFNKSKNFNNLKSININHVSQILKNDIAIIYWHIDLIELNCYVLSINSEDNNQIDIDHHISLKTDKDFYPAVDNWNDLTKTIEKTKLAQNDDEIEKLIYEVGKDINTCLSNLSKIFNIQSLVLELSKRASQVTKLILIPHRDLHGIPLHMLFTSFCGKDMLSKYTCTYLPSIQIGLNIDSSAIPGSKMLVINPPYDLRFTRLESSAVGLKSIQQFPNKTLLLEGELKTTLDEVEKKIRHDLSFNYLHFSGHAHHNPKNPRKSDLKLIKENHLTLNYIMNKLDFSNYYLICLSACETGITSPESPLEEYVGLVSAFLSQGVSYVVSTLWKVNDISTSLFMIKFYDELLYHKKQPAKALKESQQWLKTTSRERLVEWCIEQYEKLSKEKDKLLQTDWELPNDIVDQRLRRIMICSRELKESMNSENENAPVYGNPYYWAGFTITGLIE